VNEGKIPDCENNPFHYERFIIMEDSFKTVLHRYPENDSGNLIPILQAIQKKEGYISPSAVGEISSYLRISRSTIFGVASFYSQFKFNPPGRHSIKICLGTACHVQGGDFLLSALKLETGIEPGQTSPDRRFDMERVACLGCCALAPVMMVDKEIHSRMSVLKLREILKKYE
jgi:NADH-quinone oxidoreductase subunit E